MVEEAIKPGAALFEFHIFTMDENRAMWVPLTRDERGKPNKPFVIHKEELICNVPQWAITWGAKASMNMRNVQIPPMFGVL